MPKFDLMVWLPVLAAVLGYVLHSLSADGGASILARFDIQRRLKAGFVAALIVFFGLASGLVDNLIAGQDWQHALATALLATLGGVFGATKHHVNATAAIACVIGIAMTTTGCAALLHEARVITEDMGSCLIAHADLPDDKAFEVCGLATGLDEAQRQLLLAMLHEHRRQAASRAVEAADRAEMETLRKVLNTQLSAEAKTKCDGGAK